MIASKSPTLGLFAFVLVIFAVSLGGVALVVIARPRPAPKVETVSADDPAFIFDCGVSAGAIASVQLLADVVKRQTFPTNLIQELQDRVRTNNPAAWDYYHRKL